MPLKSKEEAQNPLILRCNRLMEAFAKSDDERDFYLDSKEGFLIYVDLEKSQDEIDTLEAELASDSLRYHLLPKLSFYETKKIMEGFVNEKVYDIDTKEKLIDIIQSKEARENFLEYIYDHHIEYEKWQQYYQERSRIRIIEWLRQNHFHFVFEEDLDLPLNDIEQIKSHLFDVKVSKELTAIRKQLISKAKNYYSNEALNPRPKRGRPPKQNIKLEVETPVSTDIFLTLSSAVKPFIFAPDSSTPSALTFSAKFGDEEEFLAHRRATSERSVEPASLQGINSALSALRSLSTGWTGVDEPNDKINHEKMVPAELEQPSPPIKKGSAPRAIKRPKGHKKESVKKEVIPAKTDKKTSIKLKSTAKKKSAEIVKKEVKEKTTKKESAKKKGAIKSSASKTAARTKRR